MAVAMKIGGEEIFAEVIAALLLKRLGSRRRLDRLLPSVIDGIKRLNLPKMNTKNSIEDVKKGENLVRKCSKSLRWMIKMCCFKVCCPTESDEDIARSCEDDTEANSTRNNGTEMSLNLKITLEKEDSNLDKKRVFCAVRRPPDFTVGFDKPMMELKTLLLKEEVHQLLLTAPAGCGKTTLVQMLCQDKQIKVHSFKSSFFLSAPSSFLAEVSTICGGLDGVVIWPEELTAPQTGRFGDPVEFGSSLQIRVSVDHQGENSSGAVGSGAVNAGEERNRSSVRGRQGSGNEGRQGGLVAGGHGGDNGDDDGNNRRDRIIDIENERIPQRNPRQDELVAMVALYLPLAIGLIGIAFPLDDANLSALGSVLRCLALVCGIWSTVFFAGSLLEHGRNERMAWNLSIIGSILTTLGFILVIAIKLPLNLLWIAGLAILALLAIYLRSPWT